MALSIASPGSEAPAGISGAVGEWGRRFLYAIVLPLTVLVVAAAGWYVATGETPTGLIHRLTTPPSVTMALPPRPGAQPQAKPGDALLKPPQNAAAIEAKPAAPVGGQLATVKPSAAPMPAKSDMANTDASKSAAANADRDADIPEPPPPAPARGVMPAGPSPMKPTPLAKVAEMPPPAPPPAPIAAAMPAPAPPPAPATSAMPAAPAPTAAPASTEPVAATPPAAAPAGTALTPMAATPPKDTAAPAPAPAAPAQAVPAAEAPATASVSPPAPQVVAANAPAPPPVNEPQAPPSGEPLAPPSYAQLPARSDLKPLAAAPEGDLLRDSPDGPLPITAGAKEARLAYARPVPPAVAGKEKQARVAIAVIGLGLSREAAEAAISKLPPEIDLSFSPYAGNLDTWVKKAREAGHEVLIDLPLEPPNYPLHDSGPLAVLSRDGPNAAVDRLHQILGKATGYVGVAATLRSPIESGASWPPMLKELKSRGLILVGDGPAGGAAGETPTTAAVTLVPDQTPFRASIDVQLGRLLATAQRDGGAIAYVSPRPVTFERLLAWAATLPQKDAVLVPVSALAKNQP